MRIEVGRGKNSFAGSPCSHRLFVHWAEETEDAIDDSDKNTQLDSYVSVNFALDSYCIGK